MNSSQFTSECHTLADLLEQLQQTENVLDFDSIELPFQLANATYALWRSLFSPETLQHLGDCDPDTLDAWAIALMQTLQAQQELLQTWLPLLARFPVPPKIQQRLRDTETQLQEMYRQKSQLLESVATLLSQEQRLQKAGEELQQLQQRQQALQQIQTKLEQTDLEQLKQELDERAQKLDPQHQVIAELEGEIAATNEQLTALQDQNNRLTFELETLRQRQVKTEAETQQTVSQLREFVRERRDNLSQPLADLLEDLAEQKAELEQVQQERDRAIEQFNQYQTETEQLRSHLDRHYHADAELAQRLPVNRQRVDELMRQIQANLAELDEELSNAYQIHSQTQRKQIHTFGS